MPRDCGDGGGNGDGGGGGDIVTVMDVTMGGGASGAGRMSAGALAVRQSAAPVVASGVIVEEPEDEGAAAVSGGAVSGDACVGRNGSKKSTSMRQSAPLTTSGGGSAFNALMRTPAHIANGPGEDDNALNASMFYLRAMEKGGEVETVGIDRQVATKRRLVLKMYNAMATEAEQAKLKSSESDYGERLRLTEDLNELVLTRLACMYKGYGAKLPKVLEQPKRGMKRKVPPVSFF